MFKIIDKINGVLVIVCCSAFVFLLSAVFINENTQGKYIDISKNEVVLKSQIESVRYSELLDSYLIVLASKSGQTYYKLFDCLDDKECKQHSKEFYIKAVDVIN